MHHSLSEFATLTRPSWVALQGMAHSFIESDKAVVHVISLIVFFGLFFLCVCDCGFHSLCPLMDEDKWLMEAY